MLGPTVQYPTQEINLLVSMTSMAVVYQEYDVMSLVFCPSLAVNFFAVSNPYGSIIYDDATQMLYLKMCNFPHFHVP